MSDQGEKTCPLCAEEMDLTDQQLKPCKCGYEICVWCWHHIMDMAEKDNTEGRCPACRVPYDKEKIVGMAAKCERLVAEINMEKKSKSQKSKTKPSEGRKQLSSVRVIQRNLVYIVGLPLNLANEDLLQRREYFGQYGKVLKVSMSRTSAGVIQQFPNNTCSVYITYSKEEEAIRCIQSVHGFVLDGRPLRVCFGTTKYCHAWLRNVPCTNPDCLYLHEVGSQEDSFTKDEIISAYTRVQQITGNVNTLQRRSGSMLPPPVDDYCGNSAASTGKPVVKNPSNTTTSILKGSPPNGSNGRSIALPAAASWGIRSSSFQSSEVGSACSDGASRQKSELVDGKPLLSSVVGNTVKSPMAQNNVIMKLQNNDDINTFPTLSKVHSSNSLNQHPDALALDKHMATDVAPVGKVLNSNLSYLPPVRDGNLISNVLPSVTTTSDSLRQSCTTGPVKEVCNDNDGKISTDAGEASGGTMPKPSSANSLLVEPVRNRGSQQQLSSEYEEAGASKLVAPNDGISTDHCDRGLDSQNRVTGARSGVEEDILSFDSQRLNDPLLVRLPNSASLIHPAGHMRSDPYCQSEANGLSHPHADSLLMDSKYNDNCRLHSSGGSLASNGYHDNDNLLGGSASLRSMQGTHFLPSEAREIAMGKTVNSAANSDSNHALDIGESSIISNILSLDLDAWDDSLTSPQDFARLLGRNAERSGSFKKSNSWKVQNSNQSRFSFARQEDSTNQSLGFEPSSNVSGQLPVKDIPRESYTDKVEVPNGFHPQIFGESDSFAGSRFAISPKRSSVSRPQMLAPPGFSVPSKAPPPGFSSRERTDHSLETVSRTNSQETLPLLRNSQAPQMSGNIVSAADIEFMDPAILAVGKGRLHNGINSSGLDVRSFPQQANTFENESRLQLLMQGSLSPQQNLRYIMGDGYTSLGENLGMPSRVLDRPQVGNLSPFAQSPLQQNRNSLMSNGHWDRWNDIRSVNGLGMAELLRNERLGLNGFCDGCEDSKFGMSTSGDLYKRTFGSSGPSHNFVGQPVEDQTSNSNLGSGTQQAE